MIIFMLENITGPQFKATYGITLPIDLVKYQPYVIDDTIGTDMIGKGQAKIHQGESYLHDALYEPVTNPHNPFNDIPNVPDDITI